MVKYKLPTLPLVGFRVLACDLIQVLETSFPDVEELEDRS